MNELIIASFRSLRSLFAPGMFSVLIGSVVITIIALIAFIAIITFASGPIMGLFGFSDIGFSIPLLGFLGSSIIAWMLFPGIMPIIVSFYDNKIAAVIEKSEYPDVVRSAHEVPFREEFIHDAKFALKAILLNILLLTIMWVPVVNIFGFYLLNGYLLGHEFFVMVARRFMSIKNAEKLWRENMRVVVSGGVMLTICATIPFANLVAPFWGIALMTHLFHFYKFDKFQPKDVITDLTQES
jgi:CysZ protein